MNERTKPTMIAVDAASVPPRTKPSFYPPVYAARVAGRVKHQLGEVFGLRNFGVNYTVIQPGSISALHHSHTTQDEFIYVLEGEVTLFVGDQSQVLRPGMCAGFPAGGEPHHLENCSNAPAVYLEIGDRDTKDDVLYPNDDLRAHRTESGWLFTHKDGSSY